MIIALIKRPHAGQGAEIFGQFHITGTGPG